MQFCDSSQRKDTPSSPRKAEKVTQNDNRHIQTHEDICSEGSERGTQQVSHCANDSSLMSSMFATLEL